MLTNIVQPNGGQPSVTESEKEMTTEEPTAAAGNVPMAVPVPIPQAPPHHDDISLWQQMSEMSRALADSSLLRPALQNRPADILTVLLYGRDLGLAPSVALNKIHVIDGTPSLAAEVQVGIVRAKGHRIKGAEGTDFGIVRSEAGHPIAARVRGERADTGDVLETAYTIEEAAALGKGVVQDDGRFESRSKWGKAGAWETSTADMLWARACTRLTRRLFSDVLAGITYDPEELGAFGDIADNAAAELLGEAELTAIKDALMGASDLEQIKLAWKASGLPAIASLTTAHRDRVDAFLALHKPSEIIEVEEVEEADPDTEPF